MPSAKGESIPLCPTAFIGHPSAPVTRDILYRESIPNAVMPDIFYLASISTFFGWIPANYKRG